MHPVRTEAPATTAAVALLAEFVRLGVRDVVVSPGSRSQALALAAASLEAAGRIRLHVRIDERVGGFTALGLAVETGRPVPVMTTSGTAVANLHPALLEARHTGAPIIAVTADRPLEARGVGTSQTTDQVGIFGSAVLRSWDVPAPVGEPDEPDQMIALAREVIAAVADGPVQLNLGYREPLSSRVLALPEADEAAEDEAADAAASVTAQPTVDRPTAADPATPTLGRHPLRADAAVLELRHEPGTVVIAGQDAGEDAVEAARALQAPLLAEIASGARFGPELVVAYRELLTDPDFGGQVRRAVVFGHPTLSREVPALLLRDDVETIVVRCGGAEDFNPGRRAAAIVDAIRVTGTAPDATPARRWVGSWVHTSRALIEQTAPSNPAPDVAASRSYDRLDRAAFARAELAAVREPLTRRLLSELVWQATWPHDRLVLGASRIIRDADRSVPGKRIPVHSNRGLAGIDGTIATATGIAVAAQAGEGSAAAGTTRVLLGDIAFLHDVGALLIGEGEAVPRMQVIVGNDGGGTIFDDLEVAETAEPEEFDRVLYTPQRVDFASIAAAYGWEYRRATTRGELEQALTAGEQRLIIEVPLPR